MLCLALGACQTPRASEETSHRHECLPPFDYAFGTVDGEEINSAQFRGRATVLLFATTFDLASQAAAKRLEDLYRSQSPRINAAIVVLEPARYAEMARTFAEVTRVTLPIAMADPIVLRAQGPLAKVHAVPTYVVFDAQGALCQVHLGAMTAADLSEMVRQTNTELR